MLIDVLELEGITIDAAATAGVDLIVGILILDDLTGNSLVLTL